MGAFFERDVSFNRERLIVVSAVCSFVWKFSSPCLLKGREGGGGGSLNRPGWSEKVEGGKVQWRRLGLNRGSC